MDFNPVDVDLDDDHIGVREAGRKMRIHDRPSMAQCFQCLAIGAAAIGQQSAVVVRRNITLTKFFRGSTHTQKRVEAIRIACQYSLILV